MISGQELGDRQTIADSKRAFHQRFPYVIAPLYRRLADELLVELHLLSHQKQFKSNALFAVGLDAVFRSFTKGYRPDEHPALLFDALCSSNGFQAEALKQEASATLEQVRAQSETDLSAWLQQFALADNSHYSRLMAIGLFSLLETAGSAAETKAETDTIKSKASDLSEALKLSSARVDKDISLYLANRERMEQAVELMEETLASDRRKRDQRLAESAPGTAS